MVIHTHLKLGMKFKKLSHIFYQVCILCIVSVSCTDITGYSVRINLDTEFSPVAAYIYRNLEDMTSTENAIDTVFQPQDYIIFNSAEEYTTLFVDIRFANGKSNWHKPQLVAIDQKNISSGGTSFTQRIIKQSLFYISDSILSPPAHTHLCIKNVDDDALGDGLTWVVHRIESPDNVNLTDDEKWNYLKDDEFTFYRPTLYKHKIGTKVRDTEEKIILNNYPQGIFGTYKVFMDQDSSYFLSTHFDVSSNISTKTYRIRNSRLSHIQLYMTNPDLSEAIVTLRQKN